ncbi:hypothetical protein ABB37_01143 [Leptomonas pyrrhocoris]|uniref:RRM domain-containing protein n=1 Tax=Leptomonas pyrrhocoris TaxID=157538 RepID=A0A0M9G810_LEPPY|nr:hypothetical protein ABB37_01143 [Leptomonas pyrrhocoris]KPA84620.1 hypothetical protein ABB37_01143 [Leptomonas pyrrhocoris]|eukprot:XP_015663059.1 hypothetical protein ABB37_01143 [Leptomonas pyrrhocoris]
MDELFDDEMRTNALNDPGLFLDLEEDDDDVVLSGALSLPNTLMPPPPSEHSASQPPQQQSVGQSSTTSRLSGMGIPKLDVTVLNDVTPNPAAQMQPQQQLQHNGTPGTANTPAAYSRDGAVDQLALAYGSSNPNSPPHNTATSPNLAAFNVYSNIACPPLCAKNLNFRDFLNKKIVPQKIENEESTGVFVGQLPSSYSEDDIEALLKAIGNEYGQTVQVRDVKSHNRDRTCAFVMINAGALNAVLDFTKRVLCDINCVWVVDHSQAAQLPIFVQQMPRDQLRGVPKAALVLEKLTPQSKPRHIAHPAQTGLPTSPSAAYGGIQPNLISSMSVMTHPVILQQQQHGGVAPGVGMVPPAAFMDATGLQATSPFAGSGYVPSPSMGNALPQFFSTGAFQDPGATGALFSANGGAPSPTSVYAMQMGTNSSIASIEAANQMMIAASRSRTNSQSHQLNMAPLPVPNGSADGLAPVRTAVQLTSTLQQEHCSCGRMLFLSQYPKSGTCAKCSAIINSNEVAYWCPNGHIAVCIMCALQTSVTTDANSGTNARVMQPQSEVMLH